MLLTKQGKYRFADFEIDLAHRSLRRRGRSVVVSPRTFDLLGFLVVNAQRVVSKEELMRALWPGARADESSLSQHIFILRKALTGAQSGDKLVVSIQGRGYRFTPRVVEVGLSDRGGLGANRDRAHESEPTDAEGVQGSGNLTPGTAEQASRMTIIEVEPEPERERDPVEEAREFQAAKKEMEAEEAAEAKQTEAADKAGETPEVDEKPKQAASKRSRRSERPGKLPLWEVAIFALIVAAVAVSTWWGWRWLNRGSIAGREFLGLVIADFENSTGDASLNGTLKTALAIDLNQSPYLRIATDEDVAGLIAGKAGDGQASKVQAVTAEAAREVCRRRNDQAYITGELHRVESKFLVTVRAFDCASGSGMGQSRGLADSADGVMRVMDKVAADLRKQMGEPPESVDRFSKPLFAERTGSLEALKAYSDASHLEQAGNLGDSVPLFQRAIELNPQFAMAYAHLGAVLSLLGENDLSIASLTNGYQLRESASERDRFFIVSTYNDIVTGNIQASIRNDKEWSTEYPHDPVPLTNLADLEIQIGKASQALEPAKRALELNPDEALSYVVLAHAQMNLQQIEEAAGTCRRAFNRHIDSAQIHGILLQIAFLRLDQPAMDEQMSWARGKPAEPYMLSHLGLIDFALGKAKAGQAVFAQAADGYRTRGLTSRADRLLSAEPRIEAELGLIDVAHAQLSRLPAGNGASNESADIPVAWAHVSETSRAGTILKRELDAHPTDTLWQEFKGPQITAAVALNQHQPDAAIDALRMALPYDLRSFDGPILRGHAFLMNKQATLAETEFHKILDHSGIEPLSHNYPLAQLGAARALAAQGKVAEAGFAYNVVFQIWKDADPDLPRLREAKAEYSHLGVGAAVVKSAASVQKPAKPSATRPK